MIPIAATSIGYLDDIAEQPDALVRQVNSRLPAALHHVSLHDYERIILTGMGSSHYSFIPVERALAARRLPVTRIDAGQLLDVPQRITSRTLLWAASQSGRSGELLSLLDQLRGARRPQTILATTDDLTSPLAEAADISVELHSGPEATVSTKSYLNTLAAHLRVLTVLTDGDLAEAEDDIRRTADELRTLLPRINPPAELAQNILADNKPRLAFVGVGDDAATTLTGALITKEASKVAVEGYIGGAFRHGPLELAGPGLTAVLFGRGDTADAVTAPLSADLLATGSRVVTVGPRAYPGTHHLATGQRESTIARLAQAMAQVQSLTIALAQANGEQPGQFRYGRKITATL